MFLPKSLILIFLMAVAPMLCFSNMWFDMQRRCKRESKMEFKAETSKVLRGAWTRPLLLVEEELELDKEVETRTQQSLGPIQFPKVFACSMYISGCLHTRQCLQRITLRSQKYPRRAANSEESKSCKTHTHKMALSCLLYIWTEPTEIY